MTFRIVSYNLLVPRFANQPDYYISSNVEYLQTNYRWKLIESDLEKEISSHENTIICLQELSITLLPQLELFFRRLNYSFHHSLYGHRYNDYMGVGLAIPLKIQLNSISFIKVGDYLGSINKSRKQTPSLFSTAWNIWQSVTSKFIATSSDADSWTTAIGRGNTLIVVEVSIANKPICIGTYHMPCLFKEPSVMAIHVSAVKDLMFQFAAGKDLILAGDFNLKPIEPNYRLLTEQGDVGVELPDSTNYEISYRPNRDQFLKSAYREKNGREPNYTNFADTPKSPNFCETLDYIFFAGDLTVVDVLELPDRPMSKSYPDETHPSDHLMIAATFQF